ncbi:MAG: DUF4123 domain-containing protein [Candidatus Competibacteraceae bacterium]|nr:DUF4123 domain-containing protein [Candidatus Competibacteraceae bacterium]
MAAEGVLQALAQQLFAVPDTRVYAILDGASVPELPQTLERFGVESECLFRGELEPDLALVAPYLASVRPDDPFTAWLLQEGWGRHWGVFAVAPVDLRPLRMHLRGFLKVYGPELEPLYFRYYDPRVLRVYLPTCNAQELRTMFGPVLRYLTEDEDPSALLAFWPEDGQLHTERTPVAGFSSTTRRV